MKLEDWKRDLEHFKKIKKQQEEDQAEWLAFKDKQTKKDQDYIDRMGIEPGFDTQIDRQIKIAEDAIQRLSQLNTD